jgi:superfamily I DNA/RNA helicase
MTMTRHGSDDPAVRYNALSRVIESALQKDSIPNRIVGGHKFFERMEIKDLLAYLQLAENQHVATSVRLYLLYFSLAGIRTGG